MRKVSKNFQQGLSSSKLGKPNYRKTIIQHSNYIKALNKCGLKVLTLEADDRFPDSTFIEDTAVINEDVAIIANLGAISRKGEEIEIKNVLDRFYDNVESIEEPGTLDGGDVLRVEDQYFVGISQRTNKAGALRLKDLLKKYGYSCSLVKLKEVLHLKTGLAYIGDNNLVSSGEFIDNPLFQDYNIIKVDEDESYAANCIRVNDYVLIAEGYNKLIDSISNLGYQLIKLDMTEFRKMDGGLSCLSLRF
ncbi:MAG: dimethylarginine dimethylaminohydrolase family protein [Candidatus Hodarchaeota archaeon]